MCPLFLSPGNSFSSSHLFATDAKKAIISPGLSLKTKSKKQQQKKHETVNSVKLPPPLPVGLCEAAKRDGISSHLVFLNTSEFNWEAVSSGGLSIPTARSAREPMRRLALRG